MKLTNEVCVIVGASGAIGSAVARRFYAEGAHLALTFLTAEPQALCDELSRGPGRAACYRLDVGDWKHVQTVIRQIKTDFAGIDVLVNCSGTQGPIGPLEALDMAKWTKAIETNLLGSVYLARAVLPIMKERARGKIILFSGGGAAYGRPYFTSYSSSKAAVVRFAESLAQELDAANIQVNAIAPGPVRSRMWDEMRAAGEAGGPKLLEELKRMEETGGTSPDRAASLAVFLASERSNRLTGRLLSAVWDDWEHITNRMEEIAASEAFTLRRVPLK
ncbi:MAG TPA: SDR family oxidoreductase [Terriglobia bacterium]|nr:SDR family oxidoreductase [Terriglobia bacterium]